LKLILIAVLLLGGGGAGLSGLLGGGSDTTGYAEPSSSAGYSTPSTSGGYSSSSGSALSGLGGLESLLGGFSGSSGTSSGWDGEKNTGRLNTSVATGAREKYTEILGGGQDTVTVLVYMCGTDLESKSAMGTSDLQEMAGATLSDKVNVLVYTGGCKQWQNQIVSNKVNQIYKIEGGGKLRCLEKDMGKAAMTQPANLTEFINYGVKNYPANRTCLIFWDHGGGSLSGYGYDEKNPMSGSMTLKGINQALAGVKGKQKFDFIGFDACLMATMETALTLTPYADYLVGSEETEPGVGWYYTNWLTNLSKNTSMSTLEIGKNIADDFVSVCAQKCPGQKTTLSVVDLAELEHTAPEAFRDFAASTADLVKTDYKEVSDARSGAREFAVSTRIDQVDLIHLAENLGTDEGKELSDVLRSAVKYNRTGDSMTNAYGLSIYFPYKKTSKVDSAVATYEAIGLDDEYARCIQSFASMEAGGQAVSGGAADPLGSLLGMGGSSGGSIGGDLIGQMLSGMLSGNLQGVSGLTSSNSSFLGKSLDTESAAEYLSANRFDAGALVWTDGARGPVLTMSEEQWSLVQDLEFNVFYDDGEGFLDLGLDDTYEFTDAGALKGTWDGSWLAVNGQVVAYYRTDTVDDGENYTITGRIPALVNGDRSELIVVFDNEHPYGYLAGVRSDYINGETETVAKGADTLQEGDQIDFLCDYYGYDGTYLNSYMFGEPMTYRGEFELSNVYLPDPENASATLRFTDIYNQQYWTPEMTLAG